jgi:hypothetical protein
LLAERQILEDERLMATRTEPIMRNSRKTNSNMGPIVARMLLESQYRPGDLILAKDRIVLRRLRIEHLRSVIDIKQELYKVVTFR